MERPVVAHLQPSVALVHRARVVVLAGGVGGEAVGARLGEGAAHIVVRGGVVLLQRQHVLAALPRDWG